MIWAGGFTGRNYITMDIGNLFADNVFLRWLRGNSRRHDLATSMVGLKLGERVLQVGLADGVLFAALGGKVGYTGRACGVDDDAEVVARAARHAERAGVLVEARHTSYASLPFDDDSFDVAVILQTGGPATLKGGALGEVQRVLRAGGRVVVVGTTAGRPANAAGADWVGAMASHGFKGSHVLAERDKLVFVEAVKPRA